MVGAVAIGASVTVWALEADAPVEAAHDGGPAPVPVLSPTPTRPSTTTTTLPPPRTATVVFGGDVLIHQGVWSAAAVPGGFDFSPMLAPIAPVLTAADLALCHLEVTLAPAGGTLSGYPRFRAPGALAADLAEAGFDGCSVASNHALDAGAQGITSTLDLLDAAGLGHAGTARTPEEDRQPATYVAGGIAVAHLSYAYGFNGLRPPADEPWRVDAIDPARILADARDARAAGADAVIVSLHWGNEYDHDVTAHQQAVADALAAVPGAVDLVVGHHAHVVQGISKVGDLWVVWGMGNLLSNNSPGCCRDDTTDGMLVTVALGDRPDRAGVAVTAVRFTPTWNERRTFQVLPAAETLAAGVADPELAADLRASYARTAQHALALTGGALPVTPTAALPPG